MTSMAVTRSFECAPHATRSLAMALTLSLNLVILLFALLPRTPFPVQVPIPLSLQATVLQQPPAVVPPPPVPTLHAARHMTTTPDVHIAIAHPAPISMPAASAIVPIPTTPTSMPAVTADAATSATNSEATIAYETATPPTYPIQALRGGVQGTVLLKVLVDAGGKPVQVAIERSSGSRILDDAARRHVLAAWRFHPAMREGRAIEAWALVPVQFNLGRG